MSAPLASGAATSRSHCRAPSSTSPIRQLLRLLFARVAPGRGRQLRGVDERRRGGGRRAQARSRSTARAPATSRAPRRPRAHGSSTSRPTTSSTAPSGAPYVESDAPAPLSAYGRSKLDGELRGRARGARQPHDRPLRRGCSAPAARCFPKTILRLAAERDAVRVVDDQIGCPTYTGHLARRSCGSPARQPLGRAARRRRRVSARGSSSPREIVAAAGLACEVRPITTAEYPRPRRGRPYSVLASERGAPALPDWREGLARVHVRAARVTRVKLLVCGGAGFIGSTSCGSASASTATT